MPVSESRISLQSCVPSFPCYSQFESRYYSVSAEGTFGARVCKTHYVLEGTVSVFPYMSESIHSLLDLARPWSCSRVCFDGRVVLPDFTGDPNVLDSVLIVTSNGEPIFLMLRSPILHSKIIQQASLLSQIARFRFTLVLSLSGVNYAVLDAWASVSICNAAALPSLQSCSLSPHICLSTGFVSLVLPA